jgi:hypothetical protein
MLLAMFFRFWGFKRWVFPDEFGHRRRGSITPEPSTEEELGHS